MYNLYDNAFSFFVSKEVSVRNDIHLKTFMYSMKLYANKELTL